MRRIRTAIDVAAPVDEVWPLLAEFRHWPEWGPTVRAVAAPTAAVAPGVRGRVLTPVRLWLPFEITEVEPLRSWDWRVAGVPATSHRITATAPSRCRVEFAVSALLAPYVLVLRRGLIELRRLAEAG